MKSFKNYSEISVHQLGYLTSLERYSCTSGCQESLLSLCYFDETSTISFAKSRESIQNWISKSYLKRLAMNYSLVSWNFSSSDMRLRIS